MQNLVKIKHEMNNRTIEEPSYISRIDDKSLQLSDIVVLYNDNFVWKIVPLEIMRMYPVIHDQYENKIITVYVCPYTLYSCVYFGQFYPNNQVYNNNLTLVNNNNIAHLGNTNATDEGIKNTLIDLFLIANSNSVISLSVYGWGSGFSEWTSKIFGIPFIKKILENRIINLC